MSSSTIKDAIEQAINKAHGRAKLKEIYETVLVLKSFKSKTPRESIRSELYRNPDRFRQNEDGTWSLGRSTILKREKRSGTVEAQPDSSIVTAAGVYMPYAYKDENDLEKNVESHATEVFGPNTFYFPLKWKVESSVGARHIDGLVLNLTDAKKPEAKIVEYETVRSDLRHIESQLRDFHRALNDDATTSRIARKAYQEFKQSSETFQRARSLVGKDADLYSLIDEALSSNHSILLVLDDLFAKEGFDYPKRLQDRVKDIETTIEVMEFKTFKKDDEFIHYYRFPLGR